MKRTRFWVGVLAAAALLSVGAILLLGRWSGGGHMARIYQDGVLIREIDLDSLSAPLTFTVEFQGRTNTITAVLKIPLYPFYAFAFVCMIFMTIALAWHMIRVFLAIGNDECAEEVTKSWA